MSDYALGATIHRCFSTAVSGVGTTLSGTPTVAAYAGDSTTEITAGITLTVDFDGRTGLNHLAIVASAGNGFAAGTDYSIVITQGTVGGSNVANTPVAEFSIEKASVASLAANSVTASALAADAVAEIQSGLAASSAVATLQTSVDDLPTNAELSSALAAADDATLAAIAALPTPLTAAGVRAAVGMASANLDTQLGDLPTNAELATALASADDATLAAIAALPVPLTAAAVRSALGLAAANLDTQIAALPTADEIGDDVAARTLLADVRKVNNTAISGAGTEFNPWGPA